MIFTRKQVSPTNFFLNIIFYNIFQVSARQIMRTMIRKRKLLNNDIVQEKKPKEMRTACGGSHNNIIDFSILISSINLFRNERTTHRPIQ